MNPKNFVQTIKSNFQKQFRERQIFWSQGIFIFYLVFNNVYEITLGLEANISCAILFYFSLPDGIYVRAFEDRMDLYSVMIKGPEKTPYEGII